MPHPKEEEKDDTRDNQDSQFSGTQNAHDKERIAFGPTPVLQIEGNARLGQRRGQRWVQSQGHKRGNSFYE